MAPFKSSLARSASKLLGVFRDRDTSIRGYKQEARRPPETITITASGVGEAIRSGGKAYISWTSSGAVVTGVLTATSGSFTGNVSVGGTLTYEDVTNVDAVGVITARSGVNVTGGSVVVGSAVTVNSSGINVVGVITATSFTGDGSGLSGVESWNQFDTWLYGGG